MGLSGFFCVLVMIADQAQALEDKPCPNPNMVEVEAPPRMER